MKKLDRSRPYAMSYPSGRLLQDGCEFHPQTGEEMKPIPEPPPVAVQTEEYIPEARHIDLRLKENAHLRPSFIARKAAEAIGQ